MLKMVMLKMAMLKMAISEMVILILLKPILKTFEQILMRPMQKPP